jgi:hypothetical protein
MLGLTLGFAMLATGCATTTGSAAIEPGADTFCRIARPITWSVSDTDATVREVKEHNAAYVRLCGGGG